MVRAFIRVTSGLTTKYRLSEVIHRLPAGRLRSPAPQTVNNFAAAGSVLVFDLICLYPVHGFPLPAGQVCQRPVAPTTFSFMDRPPGAA